MDYMLQMVKIGPYIFGRDWCLIMFLFILLQQCDIRRGSQTPPHFLKIRRQQTTAAETDRGNSFLITLIIIITETSITNIQQYKMTKPPQQNAFGFFATLLKCLY